MRKTIFYVLTVLLCAITANALRFQASLTTIRIEAQPGQTFTRHFILTLDPHEKRAQFRAHTEDWWRSEDGRQSFYQPPGTLKRSCANWIKLNPVESAIKGGETLDVRMSIAVPAEIKPGGYWCALTVDEVPDPLQAPGGSGVQCLTSISVGVFVNVGSVNRAAEIAEVRLTNRESKVTLRNRGDCPLSVEGRLEFLLPGENKPVATAAFPRVWLLPEPVDSATLTATLPDAAHLPSGRYLVRAIFDIGLPHYIGARKEMQVSHEKALSSDNTPQ